MIWTAFHPPPKKNDRFPITAHRFPVLILIYAAVLYCIVLYTTVLEKGGVSKKTKKNNMDKVVARKAVLQISTLGAVQPHTSRLIPHTVRVFTPSLFIYFKNNTSFHRPCRGRLGVYPLYLRALLFPLGPARTFVTQQ